jgi:serine/threonine protein kinase
MTLKSGTRLGQYEIAGAIGAGGMGEVYQVHNTKLGRNVAIKVLPEAFAHDPDRLPRFQREARMLAALNHPAIADHPWAGGIERHELSSRCPVALLGLLPEYIIADLKSVHATYAAYMQPCDRHDTNVSERPRTSDGPVSEEKSLFGELRDGPRTLANTDYC